jgi:hypothetical protein
LVELMTQDIIEKEGLPCNIGASLTSRRFCVRPHS